MTEDPASPLFRPEVANTQNRRVRGVMGLCALLGVFGLMLSFHRAGQELG